MLGVGRHRKVLRGGVQCRLFLAGAYAPRARHPRRLRPAQERDRKALGPGAHGAARHGDDGVIGRLLLRLILVPLGAAVALAAAGALLVVTQWNDFHAVLAADPQAQQDYWFALMVAGPLLVSLMSA